MAEPDPGTSAPDAGDGSGDYADVLSVVGEEKRMAILDAFVECNRSEGDGPPLPFSELRDRSGIEDKGNFNYHLDRLRDHFVEKCEAGYELTNVGETFVGLLIGGAYDGRTEYGVADETCPKRDCTESIVVRIESGRTRVKCKGDHPLFETSLLPGVADGRDGQTLLEIAAMQWQEVVELTAAGVCHKCYGHDIGTFGSKEIEGEVYWAYQSECNRCGTTFLLPPGALVVRHPAIVALYHDHGVDVRERYPWTFDFFRPEAYDVVSEDPFRITVRAEFDDDAVEITLDRDGDLVDVVEER